jgi:hypothetical protein
MLPVGDNRFVRKYSYNERQNESGRTMRNLKSSIFWDITPYSPLKANRSFGGTCQLHLQGGRINQARKSVDFQQTTPRYIPEHRTLYNHRRENLRYYTYEKSDPFMLCPVHIKRKRERKENSVLNPGQINNSSVFKP